MKFLAHRYFLDSRHGVFTHFLMQMGPLKHLRGENPLRSHYNGGDARCCCSGQRSQRLNNIMSAERQDAENSQTPPLCFHHTLI